MGMQWIGTVLLAASLCGCMPQVQSATPLFDPGRDTLKPGLWAFLRDDDGAVCPTPTGAAVLRWSQCATPVLIEGATARLLVGGPVQMTLRLADGTPRILLANWVEPSPVTTTDRKRADEAWGYWSFDPTGQSPFVGGSVRTLRCPNTADRPIIDGLTKTKDDPPACVADRATAVRAVAAFQQRDEPDFRAVWIGPYD